MKLAGYLAAVDALIKSFSENLRKGHDCYRCRKRIKGTRQEYHCAACGRQSCSGCLVPCRACGARICLDCFVICRKCGQTFCAQCAPRCSGCGRPVCSRCAGRCEDCGNWVCADCKKDPAARLAYLCWGRLKPEVICRPCYEARFTELEEAFRKAGRIKTYPPPPFRPDQAGLPFPPGRPGFPGHPEGREMPPGRTVWFTTPFFADREEAMKALRVTAAYLKAESVHQVWCRPHKVCLDSGVGRLWSAEGRALLKE